MNASKSSKTSGPSSVGFPFVVVLVSASLAMAGSYHGARGDYVLAMSRLAVLTAAFAVVGANACVRLRGTP